MKRDCNNFYVLFDKLLKIFENKYDAIRASCSSWHFHMFYNRVSFITIYVFLLIAYELKLYHVLLVNLNVRSMYFEVPLQSLSFALALCAS